MNTIKKVTFFFGIFFFTTIGYFAPTSAMEHAKLSSAALGATVITTTSGRVTPAVALSATSTAKEQPKAQLIVTVVDYMGKAARERIDLFFSILKATMVDTPQDVPSSFKLGQNTEESALRTLENGLERDPIDEAAVSKLGVYVTTQLESLSEKLVSEHVAKIVDSIKQGHVERQLAASAPARDRDFNKFAAGISRQAELFPAVVIAKKKAPFVLAWAKAERQRITELEKLDNQEKLAAAKKFLSQGIEIEIINEKEKSPFLIESKPSENDAAFRKGGNLGVKLINALEEFGNDHDDASNKIYAQIYTWILEATSGSFEDSIKYFRGFERTLYVLQPNKISNTNKAGIVNKRFQKWEEFAKTIIHAKTQDQLFYCILRTDILFAHE